MILERFCAIVAWLAVFASAATVHAADKARRPNVLFLIADDLNNLLGCYGDPLAKTPNIDRLAAHGVRFDRAYCSYPLCGPSRNSFLTGLYPNTTGIQSNGQIFRQTIPAQASMPQAFRHSGYFAGRIGKLYHYNVPNSIGTDGHDDPASWELQLNPAGVDRLEEQPRIFTLIPGQFGGTLSWYASLQSDEHHTDGMNAEDAIWVLERCAAAGPALLPRRWLLPPAHAVCRAPNVLRPPSRKRHARRPGRKRGPGRHSSAALASYKKEQDKLTDDLRRQCRQGYSASISFMDAQVGRVLDALDRLGMADNTIIVFTSDHGYHMGEHGLWQKMSLFEESTRVPLLIVAPGKSSKGGVAKSPVSQVDLFPTLAELCGVETPSNLQGQSLVAALKDPETVGRGWAITQVSRGGQGRREARAHDPDRFFGYSLRTPRWRYTEWDEGRKGRELYDHDADPHELTNLAERPEHAQTISELSQQLSAGVKTTFPASGETPEVQGGQWAPNLTEH